MTGVDGAAVRMGYDSKGLFKTWMDDPDKGYWEYHYNALGELTRQRDAKNQATDFDYDDLGRMTRRYDRTGVSSLGDQSYSTVSNTVSVYDTGTSTGSTVNRRGQLLSESLYDNGGTSSLRHQRHYTYDSFGRVSRVSTSVDSNTYAEETTYDQYGRVFQHYDVSGDFQGVRYIYNPQGYPSQSQEARQGANGRVYRTITERDARGNITAATYGNGVQVQHSYAADDGRLTARVADSGAVQDLSYSYDDLGNLNQRIDRSGTKDLTETLTYDDLYRVTEVRLTDPGRNLVNALTTAASYDAGGNISAMNGQAFSYGSQAVNCTMPDEVLPGPHAVSQYQNIDRCYDANGNEVRTSNGRSIAYTAFDKPSEITQAGQTTRLAYGPARTRYERIDNETETTYYLGNVELRIDANGNRTYRRYIDDVAIVTATDQRPEASVQYLHRDHLGSLDVITDKAGNVVSALSFDVFGTRRDAGDWQVPLTVLQAPAFNTAADMTDRGYTGHEHLDRLGLIHMNGRVYDPYLCRFIQADPYIPDPTNSQSLNRYSYVLNNPLSYTDPSGYQHHRGSGFDDDTGNQLPLIPFGGAPSASGGINAVKANLTSDQLLNLRINNVSENALGGNNSTALQVAQADIEWDDDSTKSSASEVTESIGIDFADDHRPEERVFKSDSLFELIHNDQFRDALRKAMISLSLDARTRDGLRDHRTIGLIFRSNTKGEIEVIPEQGDPLVIKGQIHMPNAFLGKQIETIRNQDPLAVLILLERTKRQSFIINQEGFFRNLSQVADAPLIVQTRGTEKGVFIFTEDRGPIGPLLPTVDENGFRLVPSVEGFINIGSDND